MATDLGNLSLGIEIPGLVALDALEARLNTLGATPRVLSIGADTGRAQSEVNNLNIAMKALEGNTKAATTAMLGLSGATVGILAVGAALAVAVKSAERFQQSMANLQAVGHFNTPDFAALGAGIQESARVTVFTVTQIAQADTVLAKSGGDANAIMREQRDVLNLASASNATAAEAATGMVTAQKSFGLTAKDSTAIANDLSKAVDSSVGTFLDMTEALKQVGPVAQQAGLSFKDTTTAIAALQNAGLQGDTGAGLKIFLQRLEAPTAGAQKAIHDLGIEVYDADGKMRSLADIADQLRLKTAGLTDEAKNADLTKIFGARGVRVADVFAEQGSDGLQAVTEHEALLGTAADIAQTKLATLSGQMKELKSSGDTVAANIGGVLVPALTAAGSEFTDLLNSVTKLTGGLADLSGAGKYGQQISDAVKAATIAPIGDQGFTLDERRSNLLKEQQSLMEDIKKMQPNVDAAKGDILGHLLGDDGGKAKLDVAKEGLQQVNAEIAKLDPATMAAQGMQKLSQQEADFANQFSRGKITMDEAIASGQAWANTALSMGADTAKVTTNLQDYEVALKNIANAQYQARYVELQAQQDERDRAKELLNKGAPADLVETAIFGKGLGMDPAFLLQQEKALKEWETDYAETQKKIQAERTAGDTALSAAYTEQKRQIQELGTANEQAAQKSAEAWKAANTAVGVIEKAKDVPSIASSAEGLDTARTTLADLGKSNVHLDALAGIADKFAEIKKATDDAKAAFVAYSLTLTETDKAEASLKGIQTRYLEALNEAEKRKAAGTATSADDQLIASRTSVLNEFNNQQQGLSKNASSDMLSIVQHLPDFVAIDNMQRQTIQSMGGSAAVIGSIQTEAAKAEAELTALEKQDRQTVIQVRAETTQALKDIDALIKAIPVDKTIRVNISYGDAAGNPAGPPLPPGYSDQGGGAGGDWNHFQPLAQQDFMAIAHSGAMPGTSSPFEDPAVYASVMRAAQQYGVDPRALLAFTKSENHNATDISPELSAAHNYGGIKYSEGASHPEGESRGPMSPEGDNYASFATADNFFKALAANLSTGAYAGDYSAGGRSGLLNVANRYVGQPGADNNARVDDYYQYASQYPATSGGGEGGVLPGYGPGTYSSTGGALNTGEVAVGGPQEQQIEATARAALGQTTTVVNGVQTRVYGWCEKILDDILQQALGFDSRFGNADARVRAAQAGQKGAGTVISQQDARAGDIVGWRGDSAYAGDPAGHVGVYSGNGNYIGTTQQGVQERPIGPDAVFIRPDGVVAGGPVPGSVMYQTGGAIAHGVTSADLGASPAAHSTSIGTIPSVDGTKTSVDQVKAATIDLKIEAAAVVEQFSHMDAPSIKAAQQEFTNIVPILTSIHEKALEVNRDPATVTATEKQNAQNAAVQQGLLYQAAFAQLVRDMEQHTGNIKDDEEAITQSLMAQGGAAAGLAENLTRQAVASAQMATAQSTIKTLQDEQTKADDAHTKLVNDRQAADQAASRALTRQGWADQDAQQAQQRAAQRATTALQLRQQQEQYRLQDATTAENDHYQAIQRSEQDRQRDLQFQQQLQATALQNQLTDVTKQQQNQVYNRTSQEQLQAANVAGAATNLDAGKAAATLAAMHEADLAQRDKNTQEINNIQAAIREEARRANLESYNLQTETIASSRAHQDRVSQLTEQGVLQQRNHADQTRNLQQQQQAQQQASQAALQGIARQRQEEAWRQQDERQGQDQAYQKAKDANRDAIIAEQGKLTSAQAELDLAKQAQKVFDDTDGTVINIGQNLAAAFGANTNVSASNPTGLGNVPGHASGGIIPLTEEYSLVGEEGPELIRRPGYSVSTAGQTAAMLGGTTSVTLNLGDVNLMLSEQDKTEIRMFVEQKVNAARKAGINARRSLGVN